MGEDMLEDVELEQSWRRHGDPTTEHHSHAPSHSEALTALSFHSPEALKALGKCFPFPIVLTKTQGWVTCCSLKLHGSKGKGCYRSAQFSLPVLALDPAVVMWASLMMQKGCCQGKP